MNNCSIYLYAIQIHNIQSVDGFDINFVGQSISHNWYNL